MKRTIAAQNARAVRAVAGSIDKDVDTQYLKRKLQAAEQRASQWASIAAENRGALDALRSSIASLVIGQVPVAAQCRFVGDSVWSSCSIEHHQLVQDHPQEWLGYETRLLYDAPLMKILDEADRAFSDEGKK